MPPCDHLLEVRVEWTKGGCRSNPGKRQKWSRPQGPEAAATAVPSRKREFQAGEGGNSVASGGLVAHGFGLFGAGVPV